MYIICKKSTANLKLTDNLIVSPDKSTVYGELCWPTGQQNWEASGLKQLWLHAVSDGIVSAECHHTNFNSYIQIYDRQ
jgi:hypothetical protein